MSKKNNTTQNSNTATKKTVNTNTQNKEENIMKNLSTMSYRELQIFATTNNIPVKKSGKGITKDVLRKSIEDYLEEMAMNVSASEPVEETPVVEKTIDHTEEVKAILKEAETSAPEMDEEVLDRLIPLLPNPNPDEVALRKALKADLWGKRDIFKTTYTGWVTSPTVGLTKYEEEDMNMNSINPSTITTMPVISNIMDGEYHKIDLAEKVYTAIWECLPYSGRTLMDGLTILTLGTVYAVEDFVNFTREKVVPVVVSLAKDTAEGITQWWQTEGKPFAEDLVDEVSADAEAFAETIIIPTAKKVGRNIINGAKRFVRGLKKGWAMRSDLINEYKEVA